MVKKNEKDTKKIDLFNYKNYLILSLALLISLVFAAGYAFIGISHIIYDLSGGLIDYFTFGYIFLGLSWIWGIMTIVMVYKEFFSKNNKTKFTKVNK